MSFFASNHDCGPCLGFVAILIVPELQMRARASVPRRSIDAQTPVLADPELVQPITTDPSSAISTTTQRDRDPRLKPPNGSVVENAPSREDPEDSLSGVGRNIGVRMFPGQWAGLCTTACTLSAPGRDGGTGRRAGLKIPWASARAGSTPAPGTHTTWPSPVRSPVPNRLNDSGEMSTDGADPVVTSSAITLPTIGPCWNP